MDIFSWSAGLPDIVGGHLAVVGNLVLDVTATVYDHVTGSGLLSAVYAGMCLALVAGIATTVTLDRRTGRNDR